MGRVPDGEIVLKSGKVVAIQPDLAAERSTVLERIARTYPRSAYDAIWWLVRPGSADCPSAVFTTSSAARLKEVYEWT